MYQVFLMEETTIKIHPWYYFFFHEITLAVKQLFIFKRDTLCYFEM